MSTEPADLRDIEGATVSPVYRVYFWHRPVAPPGVAQHDIAYHSEEWRGAGCE